MGRFCLLWNGQRIFISHPPFFFFCWKSHPKQTSHKWPMCISNIQLPKLIEAGSIETGNCYQHRNNPPIFHSPLTYVCNIGHKFCHVSCECPLEKSEKFQVPLALLIDKLVLMHQWLALMACFGLRRVE